MSAINEDTRTENSTQSSYIPEFLFSPKANASYYKQYKIEANYASEIGSIGATYERVDPNYNTLGAYYFTNDFENITLNLITSLFKRITISMNGGLQRDDLENQKTSSMDRFVFSTNISVRASKNLSFNVSYSNFQTYSHIKPLLKDDTSRTQFDKSDTLKYTQINQTISFGINYALPSTKDKKQSVNFNLMYQQASNKQGDNAEVIGSRFYNTSGSYSLSYTPLNINFTAATNYNQSKTGNNDSKVVGLNLSLNKSFFKNQVKSTISSSFNNTYLNGADNGAIINTRFNNTYTLYKKHNFGLNMCVINNKTKQNYNDLTITFNYGYNFNADLSRKNKKLKVEANF